MMRMVACELFMTDEKSSQVLVGCEDEVGGWRRHGPCIVLAVIVLATAFVRPGDTPWINDEPLLIHQAMRFNAGMPDHSGIQIPFTNGTLAYLGLYGNRGARYGPVPVWVYQLFLLITHDPILMVMMRAILVGGTTAAAMYWLSRSMKVTPWLAVVAMLSPWMWIYSRQLWDNSFCIPLSAMAIAAYAGFLLTRRPWPLWLSAACGALLPLTHLMAFALIVPLGLHFALGQWRWIIRHGWSALITLIIVAGIQALAWPYWQWMWMNYRVEPGEGSPLAGFFFPLLGGHHLSAAGLGNILGDGWLYTTGRVAPYLIAAAQAFTLLAYAAVWIGMFLAWLRARRIIRRAQATASDHLALIALGIWFCQGLLDASQCVYDGPHYFNATWIAYAVFVFFTVEALYRWAWDSVLTRLALPAYGLALLIVLGAMIAKVAHDGGTRTMGYGTTMAQQMAAVAQIRGFSDDSQKQFAIVGIKQCPFPQWSNYPWAFVVLRGLLPPPSGPRSDGPILVHYRDAFPGDARIVVDAVAHAPSSVAAR